MWFRDARERCPQLLVVPYDFEAYAQVSPALPFIGSSGDGHGLVSLCPAVGELCATD